MAFSDLAQNVHRNQQQAAVTAAAAAAASAVAAAAATVTRLAHIECKQIVCSQAKRLTIFGPGRASYIATRLQTCGLSNNKTAFLDAYRARVCKISA